MPEENIQTPSQQERFPKTGIAGTAASAPLSVMEAVRFAYSFLGYRPGTMLRLLWLPFLLAGVTLYVCLSGYLTDLLLFLSAPSSKLASRALGTLAAGIVLALFLYTSAIVSVTNLALERPRDSRWISLRAGRQEWLLFWAYLRFLLLIVALVVCLWEVSVLAEAALAMPRDVSWLATAVVVMAGTFWLFLRIGFLLPPIAVRAEEPVLRLAWKRSGKDFWRITAVVVLLLVPGLMVQLVGEWLLRAWNSVPSDVQAIPIADYAQFMERTLGTGILTTSLSFLVTIVLLSAGAVAVHEKRSWPRPPLSHMPPRVDAGATPTHAETSGI
jgi:hypothetical protein